MYTLVPEVRSVTTGLHQPTHWSSSEVVCTWSPVLVWIELQMQNFYCMYAEVPISPHRRSHWVKIGPRFRVKLETQYIWINASGALEVKRWEGQLLIAIVLSYMYINLRAESTGTVFSRYCRWTGTGFSSWRENNEEKWIYRRYITTMFKWQRCCRYA